MDDVTAIWCFQLSGNQVHVVDYYENSGHGADHYCDWLDAKGYHGTDWVPQDARVREWGMPGARTRVETLFKLGRRPKVVTPHKLMDGIQAGRKTIPFARFDAKRCAKGLDCLREYRADWDDQGLTFRKSPKHNWASHGADAWRYLSRRLAVPAGEGSSARPRGFPRGWEQFTVDEFLTQVVPKRIRI